MRIAIRPTLGLMCVALLPQFGCVSLTQFLQKSSPSLDTSLLEAQGYSVPPGGMPMAVSSAGSEKPSIVLELRTNGNERHVERIPISMDQGVFIQDIVQQAQLHNKLGNLRISIMRPNGSAAPPVRLDLRTDKHGKTDEGTNYALLPGDHVIVNEDNRSTLEKLMESQFPKA